MAYNNQGQPQIPPYSVPIVYYAALEPYYAKQASTFLGLAQILAGCVSIAAASMAFAYYAELCEIGTGFWCGIFYIVAGSIFTAAGIDPTNQLITMAAVLSFFDLLFGITQLVIASIGLADDTNTSKDQAIAANAMMVGVGAWVTISGLWLLVISCRAVKEGNKTQIVGPPVAYAATQPERMFIQGPTFQPRPQPPPQPPPLQGYYGHQQYPSIPNSQHMMYPGAQQTPPTIMKPEIRPPRY